MRLGLVVIGIFVMAGGIPVVVLPKTSLAARNLNLLEIDHGVPDGAVRNGIDRWVVMGISVVACGLGLIAIGPAVGRARTRATLLALPNPPLSPIRSPSRPPCSWMAVERVLPATEPCGSEPTGGRWRTA